ncbi:MAG: hypothetical protein Q7S73_02340 [bacterium]|nr:hypothetical protein [bacterium]
MNNLNIIKLAPTLSARERAKILITDYHKVLSGEKAVISEPEKQALLRFEDRNVWKEYLRYIEFYKWVNVLWKNEIKNSGVQILALSLYLSSFQRFLATGTDEHFYRDGEVKTMVGLVKDHIKNLLEYHQALQELEVEIDLVPMLNKKAHLEIKKAWELIESWITKYNNFFDFIQKLLADENVEHEGYEYCKSILKDKEQFLIIKPPLDKAVVNQLVQDMKELVESELEIVEK